MQHRSRSLASAFAAFALLVLTGVALLGLAGGASGAPSKQARTVAGSVPEFAKTANRVGSAHGRVDFSLVLPFRDQAGLESFNASVSDPASASYGDYLTPEEFRDRFSPTAADQAAARDWLRSKGFRLTASTESGALIGATGNTAEVERVFRTSVERFRSAGQTLRAPADSITLPAALDGVAVDVTGISDAPAEPATAGNPVLDRSAAAAPAPRAGDDPAPPAPLFRNAGPCSRSWAERTATTEPSAYGAKRPWIPCGYVPRQLQSAYGIRGAVNSGNDGAGEVVTVIDAFGSPTIERDAQRYASNNGQPPLDYRETLFTGCKRFCGDTNKQGWYGEQTLDVEAVHAMAPGATVQYVGGYDNGQGLTEALAYVVDNADDLDTSIVTNSYGYRTERLPSGVVRSQEQIHQQAVAEGVGLYFSSGDDGDQKAVVGYETPTYPPSSPNVTAVGGTSLAVGPTGDNRFELGWGTYIAEDGGKRWKPKPPGEFLYGSGGGVSQTFSQPGYQAGVVPDQLAGRYGGLGRAVPDISAVGDPVTGMSVGQTQTSPSGKVAYSTYRIGGTSLSSPLFAGFMALADQRAGFAHGFANPAFYDLAGDDVFRDIVPARRKVAVVRNDFVNGVNKADGFAATLRTFDMDSSLETAPGYDDVTGIGSPIGESTLDALAGTDN